MNEALGWIPITEKKKKKKNPKKQDPTLCCLQETYHTTKDTSKLKENNWKKIYQACRN
jgi:hypothetical protein